ncbi:unnamed protein product [Ambrosiozyma monospora]|uniref:Unnamed protein product n=1 Tax=Ambrosiozyma monospora TaxID=43982 RepID=A0ACB5SS32_AMBMO|nr:unnamed protein product [Ambrosiozyma monospora]
MLEFPEEVKGYLEVVAKFIESSHLVVTNKLGSTCEGLLFVNKCQSSKLKLLPFSSHVFLNLFNSELIKKIERIQKGVLGMIAGVPKCTPSQFRHYDKYGMKKLEYMFGLLTKGKNDKVETKTKKRAHNRMDALTGHQKVSADKYFVIFPSGFLI